MSNLSTPDFEKRGACMYPADDVGYHEFEAICGENANGELFEAFVGVYGTGKHILSRSYDRVTPRQRTVGYHEFEIRDGTLFGRIGAIEHDLGSWPPAGIDQ